MATKKKLLQAAAGSAGGAALDIPDVFSTYLYTGTGSTETVTNNIDLSGEGGLVWIKDRSEGTTGTGWHNLYDTERGTFKMLHTHDTGFQYNGSPSRGISAFNSDGFVINEPFHGTISGNDYVSWTFRKAPKFFDIQTWSGTSSTRTISHNLGCTPGMIIIKSYDSNATNWMVWHNGLTNTATKFMYLNNTDQEASYGNTAIAWGNTAPTSTEFTVGAATYNNETGKNYVAYIFAHNSGDGEFGPDQDQDIIKCGAYTGNGGVLDVNLGFEAGWVLVKKRDNSGTDWHLFDEMRLMPVGYDAYWLETNTYNVESNNQYMSGTPTGFRLPAGHPEVNTSGEGYIYMAIRRGFLTPPTDATEVFAIDTAGGTSPTPPTFVSNFPVDFQFYKNTGGSDTLAQSRVTNFGNLAFSQTSAESLNNGTFWEKDYNNGVGSNTGTNSNALMYMWRRSPSYLDVITYTGNGSTNSVLHNLGAVPEMVWIRKRNSLSGTIVGFPSLSNTAYGFLNDTDTFQTVGGNQYFQNTTWSDQYLYLGSDQDVNQSGQAYIAQVFASLNGVSKIGTYTGNGSSAGPTVNCGFSSGPRLVIIKRTDDYGQWWLFDSIRGITAGNDPYYFINLTQASQGGYDMIDPTSSGFQVISTDAQLNASGGSYLFYAIA